MLSFALTVGALQGAIVAFLLLRRRTNRASNALLAALLVAFGLRLVPYIIGYAGFYDAYPWLSFAPFALTLTYGPLIYLYVVRTTADRMPKGWWAHFVPGALQLAYYLTIFPQSLAFKNRYDVTVHVPWVDPMETFLTLISMAAYLGAALRRYRRYKAWLDDSISSAAEHGLAWIRSFLALFGATILLNAAFELCDRFVHPLNYYNRFALYAWYAALVYYLALEGWRNASQPYPQPNATTGAAVPSRKPIDSAAAANEWRQRVIREAYWRDSELTLGALADLMGMSPSAISRLVNEGLGQNFNEAINRMRVAAVQERLRDPSELRDILELALEAGFSSKASFNRCFRAYVETTPSQYRKDAVATTTPTAG